MRRLLALIGSALVLVALGAAAPSASADVRPGKVLVVSIPRLVWRDVAEQRPPALLSFLSRSAYASLSVRAIGPRTELGDGYATMGAGNRARVDPRIAGAAVGVAEVLDGKSGADLFRAATGRSPGAAQVLSLVVTEAKADAHKRLYGAEPGALGKAIEAAGMRTAVIANGDDGAPAGRDDLHREAVLALMDEAGRVAGGIVDRSLSTADPTALGERRMDENAVLTAFDRSWAEDDAVLVELSDLERVNRSPSAATEAARRTSLAGPLQRADELFGALLQRVDLTRDRVIVVSPAAPHGRGQLTVFALAGRGIVPGQARSATTRRDGYVTLPDVGVTVLDALGLDPPGSMDATAITSSGGRAFEVDDATRLADADVLARFRDRTVGPVSVVYIVLQVLAYGSAALALQKRRSGLRHVVRGAALLILSVPIVAFLSGLVAYDRLDLVVYVVLVFAVAGAIAGGAFLLGRAHPFLPAFTLVAGNWVLQVVDVVFGGRLQLDTPFGYSPIVAGRFQGFGNLAFAVLASSAIVVATGLVGMSRPTWPVDSAIGYVASRGLLAWAIGVFAITFVVDGYPTFGSDVGGVLASVPAFTVAVMLLGGWRVSARRLLVIALGTVLALSALAAVDLSRPARDRTHLGRFATDLFNGHASVIIHRKLESNWSVLTSSVWTWLVPASLAFLAFLAVRRTGLLSRLQRRVPGVRPCLLSALVVGVLGFALNDSGVAVPAMMFGIVLPWVTWLLLATEASDAPAAPPRTTVEAPAAEPFSLEPTP